MSHLIGLLLPGAVCFSTASADVSVAEDFSDWGHQGDIVLNTGSLGARVSGDVANFPLLVRLDGADFPFSEVTGRGRDIRFSDASGRHLAYQIDRWDSAAGAADIWVRLDLVKGNATDQTFKIHWGNASAPDSSDGARVFQSASGFVSAWHLGGSGTRPNAVAGGNPAVPVGYTGKESKPGVIGLADSLGWGSTAGYLDLGDGYTGFSAGFSFSAWIYPSEVGDFTHFIDLGNGAATDNIILQRHSTTQDLSFINFDGTTESNHILVQSGIVQKKWQHVAVTVSGRDLKMYRNGTRVASATLTVPINRAWRSQNYLGRSNWENDDYFQGKMDEPWLSKTARGPDWIKLSYENQKADQQMVTFRPAPALCQTRFGAPTGLTVAEGSTALLEGFADCATRYWWESLGGLPVHILDPAVEILRAAIPRVEKDTSTLFRFSARYLDSTATWDVPVRVLNTVPDPVFVLPAFLSWNGIDPIQVIPEITNLAAIKASAYPQIRYTWSLELMTADTAWLPTGLLLKSAEEGILEVKVCLDNQGEPACRTIGVRIGRALGVRSILGPNALGPSPVNFTRDVVGRSGITGKHAGYGMRFGHEGITRPWPNAQYLGRFP